MSITTIIQGPINEISVSNIPEYKKYGDVVVACWMSIPDLDLFSRARDLGAQVHTRDENSLPPSFNISNIYKQARTTYDGANEAKTDFVIKTRSDERYSDIGPIVRMMEAHPDKVITDNRSMRYSHIPLMPSDHILGMRKQLCRDAFKILAARLENPKFSFDTKARGSWHVFGRKVNPPAPGAEFGGDEVLYPEQMIALSIFEALGKDSSDIRKAMRETFEIVRIQDLGRILWRTRDNDGRGFDESYNFQGANNLWELAS